MLEPAGADFSVRVEPDGGDRGTQLGADDLDLFLTDDSIADLPTLTRLLVSVAERTHVPATTATGSVDFQFTRGLLGVTT